MSRWQVFARGGVHVQSWYPALRAASVRPGKLKTVEMLDRRIVFWRQADGRVGAMDADCPHMGADLGQGSLTPQGLRCAFHGWCYGLEDGACSAVPGQARPPKRSVRSYPVEEAWGLLWLFNGPEPLFQLPCKELGAQGGVIKVWRERLPHHPHVLAANGIDTMHFQVVHDVTEIEPSVLDQPDRYRTRLRMAVRPRRGAIRALTGTRRRPLRSSFETLGGNLAIGEVQEPLRFYNLFAGCPRPGGTDWYIFMVVPKGNGLRWAYGLGLMLAVLPNDVPVLKGLRFQPNMVPADRGLNALARQVEALPTW